MPQAKGALFWIAVALLGAPLVAVGDDNSKTDQPTNSELLSRITKAKVKNGEGKLLGHVEDLVLGLADGRIRYVVVSDGGLVGLAEKLFAVPWDATRLTYDGQAVYVVTGISEKQFDETPGFDKDNWPAFGNPKWASSADGKAPRKDGEAVLDDGETEATPRNKDSNAKAGPIWRGSKLGELSVKDSRDNTLGAIQDVVIDTSGATILYLAMPPKTGSKVKFQLVPWRRVKVITSASPPSLVLPVSIQQIRKAPSIALDDWPRRGDTKWHQAVDEYYQSILPR